VTVGERGLGWAGMWRVKRRIACCRENDTRSTRIVCLDASLLLLARFAHPHNGRAPARYLMTRKAS
jgi:hypothetical protein